MADDSHRISLKDAQRLVARARREQLLPVRCWRFDAAILREILAQRGCAGIRAHLAIADDGHPTLVLVGVDPEGRDLADGTIAEQAMPCPPVCDDKSALTAGA